MSTFDDRAGWLEELRGLERELHKGETRRNRSRMETLLHPDFVEFGRSGTRYSRADVLEEFGPESALPAIHSEDFHMVILADGVALVTYTSAHLDVAGNAHRHTLRSSIWVLTNVGWQMRFHQGTPTADAIP
jgi:hypothetical protein